MVKAFNTIRPASLASLGKPAGAAGRTVIPVAGDDPAAKSVVLELADQLGFDGLDAGPLAESWRQQPGTPVYTTDLPLDAARQALADATPEQTASWRSRHPQHKKLNTAMHPSSRTGVRFVLANPSDPSRLDEFNDWYDTYSAAITVPGYLANDIHFENPDASGENNSPRYATIYDIVSPDPATAWPDTEHSPAYPTHLFSDPRAKLVSPALRASYALVGSQLQPGQHGPLTGIHVILSNGGGDTERQHREAQILQTGLFYSAARFRIIEGSPEPAEWLEVFETDDPDPLHAYPRATSHTLPASQIQPQLSQSFRLAGARKDLSGAFSLASLPRGWSLFRFLLAPMRGTATLERCSHGFRCPHRGRQPVVSRGRSRSPGTGRPACGRRCRYLGRSAAAGGQAPAGGCPGGHHARRGERV